jgi:hypothetical protein
VFGARSLLGSALLAVLFTTTAFAHVGSPDVFFEGKAGPYQLLIAIRPPEVIPGVAKVEVRSLSPDVKRVELTPTPMNGEAAKHPPQADVAQNPTGDPQYFEGSLWLMTIGTGSWKVRIHASGTQGEGEMQIPVPTLPSRMKPMDQGVTYFLIGMMVFLTVGMVALVGAGIRESRLEPGVETKGWNGKTIGIMAATSAFLLFVIWAGNSWWANDASAASQRIYKSPGITATLTAPDHLLVQITDPGWVIPRKLDDLALDHGHLMHLFLVKWPEMDRVFHLHPDQKATGYFETDLPSLPKGNYRLYGDIVHDTGFSETAVGEASLPDVAGKPLAGDDAGGVTAPVNDETFPLEGGFKIVWTHDKTRPVAATALTLFSFSIVGPDGKPVDLEPYMGMGGHAEFVKQDGSVFAHVHPSGSVAMASVAVASQETMMGMHEGALGTSVSFPYGPPTPGSYRIFVQMKHAGKVETGAFALTVDQ